MIKQAHSFATGERIVHLRKPLARDFEKRMLNGEAPVHSARWKAVTPNEKIIRLKDEIHLLRIKNKKLQIEKLQADVCKYSAKIKLCDVKIGMRKAMNMNVSALEKTKEQLAKLLNKANNQLGIEKHALLVLENGKNGNGKP